MRADVQRTARTSRAGVWLGVLAGWGFCLAGGGVETASASYRVEGNLTPVAGGAAGNTSYSVYQVVGQPDILGDASAAGYVVLHGWRIPAAVAQLYRYALEAGWNLKGAPGLSDRSAGEIFTGAAAAPIKVGNIQYAVPGGLVEAADSDPLLGLQAFWVFSYWGGTGQWFSTPEAHTPGDGTPWRSLLQPGWNLFSPPYAVTVPPRGTGIVVVWHWVPATSSYEVILPGQNLLPLEGYWVFAAATAP